MEGRMREGMQGERREGGTNGDARENRFEAYTCVRVRCACMHACGCVIIYVAAHGWMHQLQLRNCGGFCSHVR